MGDHHRSQSSNFPAIPKSASIYDICKAYKSLVTKRHPDRNSSNKPGVEPRFTSINQVYRAISIKKKNNACNGGNHTPEKTKTSSSHGDREELQISSPTLLSRTTSRVSPLLSPTCWSRRSTTPPPVDLYTSFPITSPGGDTPTTPSTPRETALFSKIGSRGCSTPIFFSQSAVRKKSRPIEKKLECTLEELCHGGVKKIKITRNSISSSGLIVEEEEILMVNVKPGWKKGMKIKFEGKGDERPGTLPADIIFCIDEKRHPLFKRGGDDLELGVEVPLVQALTGCTVPVPLLGGRQINLSIDDIIYPGYEKIIPGQGMMTSKDGMRGDLRLKFLIEFPAELSHDQRSEIVSILEECS